MTNTSEVIRAWDERIDRVVKEVTKTYEEHAAALEQLKRTQEIADSAKAMSDYRLHRVLKLEDEKAALVHALSTMLDLANFGTADGAYKNGVTDESMYIDQGEVYAYEIIRAAQDTLDKILLP